MPFSIKQSLFPQSRRADALQRKSAIQQPSPAVATVLTEPQRPQALAGSTPALSDNKSSRQSPHHVKALIPLYIYPLDEHTWQPLYDVYVVTIATRLDLILLFIT